MIKHRSTNHQHKANGNPSLSESHGSSSASPTSQLAVRLKPPSRKPVLRSEHQKRNFVVVILAAAILLLIVLVAFLTQIPKAVFQVDPQHLVTLSSLPQQSSLLKKSKAATITSSTTTVVKVWNQPNSTLPQWMKEYFDWHVATRNALSTEKWKSYRYLILSCNENERCGGVSDRLKPLPFLLLLAYQSQRLVFIHWSNRPFRLEEFVVPHAAGINWTAPSWLLKKTGKRTNLISSTVAVHMNTNVTLLKAKIQSWDGGREYYEQHVVPSSTYEQVFSQVFESFFVPSPAVLRRLQRVMDELGLQPGRYVVAHHRANYQHRQANVTYVILASINAVNCASTMWPGVPIYFCSDSQQSIHFVQEYAKSLVSATTTTTTATSQLTPFQQRQQQQLQRQQQKRESRIVLRDAGRDAFHLDKTTLNESSASAALGVEGFFDIFVDLYLMVYAQCVAYGPGGFGRFGMLLSRNASCGLRHFYRRQMADCHWTPS